MPKQFLNSTLLSDKLFAVNRGSIDIIDLNGVLPMTQVAVESLSVAVVLSESWVSDMHIAPSHDVTNVTPSVINGSAVCNQAQIFIALNSENIDNVDEGITAIYPYPETQSIYISTVDYTGTIASPKARLYRGSYDAVGAINSQGQCWQEITDNLPNKSFTYLNANDLNSTTTNHYLYACVRGLGAWIVPVAYCQTFENTIDPANTNTWPIPNQNYNLNTNLEIASGSSYTFDSNILSIAEGISITIKNGATLNIDNSTLYACGNMWQGIIIEDGGTLNVTNATAIRDAQYGINVMSNGKLFCNDVTLDHNYVGIFIPDLQNGSVIIQGTTFSCTDCTTGYPLKGKYLAQSPTPNTVTYAGIEAYNSTFNLGVIGGAPNQFRYL